MRADRGVLLVGVILLLAATAGGSMSGAGIEIPVLDSLAQQMTVAALGVLTIAASIFLSFDSDATAGDQVDPQHIASPTPQPGSLLDSLGVGNVESRQRVHVTITIEPVGADNVFNRPDVVVGTDVDDSLRGPSLYDEVSLIGREQEIEEIRSAVLEVTLGRQSFVVVSGRFGSGKTSLVREYVHRFGHFFDAVVWMNDEVDVSKLVQASTGTLAILDEPSIDRSLLLQHIESSQAIAIVISRLPMAHVGSVTVAVPDLPLNDTVQLLLEATDSDDQPSATFIARLLQGSPLLVSLALRVIRAESLSLAEYAQRFLGARGLDDA